MRWIDWVTSALLMEVAVDKPGNVSPRHRFHDAGMQEFTRSAFAIGKVLQKSCEDRCSYGYAVYQAVSASLDATGGVNVHLGAILMVTPLVLGFEKDWRQGVANILQNITVEDTDWVFRAIAAARPGGLNQHDGVLDDVRRPASRPLLAVFSEASRYDSIAREYTRKFSSIFYDWSPQLEQAVNRGQSWDAAIYSLFLSRLSQEPDSLWIRKNGWNAAQARHRLVQKAIVDGALERLPDLLEDPDNRWNPGTTADLIAASILVALVEGDTP